MNKLLLFIQTIYKQTTSKLVAWEGETSSIKRNINSFFIKGKIRALATVLCIGLSTYTTTAQITARNVQTSTTGSTTLTINRPTDLAVGDVMLLQVVQSGNTNNTISDVASAGWTEIAGSFIENTGFPVFIKARATLLYKIATAADVGATNFSFTLDSDSEDGEGAIIAFGGVDITGGVTDTGLAGGPFDVDPGNVYTDLTTDNAFNASAITTTSANSAIILFGAISDNNSISNWNTTNPGALTELYDLPFNANEDTGMGAAWATKAAIGSTGNGTATLSGNDPQGSILIALKRYVAPPCAYPSTLPWTEGFENVDPTTHFTTNQAQINGACYWAYSKTNNGQVEFDANTHSGFHAATFDSNPTGTDGINYLVATLDLSAYSAFTNLEFSFWVYNSADENHPNDRVWIRGSNTDSWIEIYNLNDGTDSVWVHITGLDIDAAILGAGQTITSTFQIRLGQEDNFSYPLDGRIFDDLEICFTPTAYNVTGGGNGCPGDPGFDVGLDNSEIGVSYQLVEGGVTNVGAPLIGTGAALSFGIQPEGTYTVEAAAGSCTSTMTGSAVVNTVDNEDPVVTCPGNIIRNNDPGDCSAIVSFVATATDNCNVTVTYSQDPGTSFPLGATTVTATATDPSGNTDECTFTVTVVDNEAPVITCAPNGTRDTD
ncbi:HYR domain-containing protein, partial [Candidatus Saccharibacteria bacterium]|nr:HYR domain-containing protein [Candidatus Saccharibacteria bacterium]